MAQKSIIPDFLARLDPLLEEARLKWLEQPEGKRRPTLKLNGHGQVHVGDLLERMGYDTELYRQHFRKPELKGPVNALCREQGIKGIGEDAPVESVEAAVKKVIVRQDAANKRLAEHLIEAQSTIIQQQRRIAELEGQLGLAQETGMFLRNAPVRLLK